MHHITYLSLNVLGQCHNDLRQYSREKFHSMASRLPHWDYVCGFPPVHWITAQHLGARHEIHFYGQNIQIFRVIVKVSKQAQSALIHDQLTVENKTWCIPLTLKVCHIDCHTVHREATSAQDNATGPSLHLVTMNLRLFTTSGEVIWQGPHVEETLTVTKRMRLMVHPLRRSRIPHTSFWMDNV